MPGHDGISGNRAVANGLKAEEQLAALFSSAGWDVARQPKVGGKQADMIVEKSELAYLVELKALDVGRADRMIPLWAKGYLEAMRLAGSGRQLLVVIAAPRIARKAAESVLEFANEHAPNAAAGVIDFEGLQMFRGAGLENLDSQHRPQKGIYRSKGSAPAKNLFSDLNQWMLKVLLAPELPESLLSAPRARYQNVSQLAEAAAVSVMSAFRFVKGLQREGFLHESASPLNLVRRDELFASWKAAADQPVHEVPVRFLLRGEPRVELGRMLRHEHACLGLFAAAQALHVGFVDGVAPHVYVPRIDRNSLAAWNHIALAGPGEAPDAMIRQAPCPQSIFRGMVRADGLPVSDIIQVWLDVSSNRARGEEQADLIRRRVLEPIMAGDASHG